jgi:hypothetical protein
MDPHLAPAVSEHVRRLGHRYQQSMDRHPPTFLAIAGLLTAAAAIRESGDLEGALARRARPRRHNARQTLAAILGRHQSALSPEMHEAAWSLANRPGEFYLSRVTLVVS